MTYDLMTTTEEILEPGDWPDHYLIDSIVARSGMSVLYKATDMNSGREVAVKVPHAEMEADPVLHERFEREREIGLEIDHPGVVKVFSGEEQRRVYMVMEWVPGRLLRSILNRERKLPIERAVALTRNLRCDGHDAQVRRGASRPEAGEPDGQRRGPRQAD